MIITSGLNFILIIVLNFNSILNKKSQTMIKKNRGRYWKYTEQQYFCITHWPLILKHQPCQFSRLPEICMHQENRSPSNEVEISESPWYTDLNRLPQVLLIYTSFPQGTYFPDVEEFTMCMMTISSSKRLEMQRYNSYELLQQEKVSFGSLVLYQL